MAYERLSDKTIISTNLGSFISSQISLFQKLRTRRNLEDESRFSQAVLEDNLTLEQQLTYRRDQLKRIKKSDAGDIDEIRRIRNEIASLKDRIEQKEFDDEYLSKLTTLNEGVSSIDNTINWLNNRLIRTTDQAIITKIRNNISQLKLRRYEQQQNALSSQTTYANESKSEDIINKQINNIGDARAKAVIAGNDDYVALLDLQLQSLNKALVETEINKTMLNFSVATMTGQSSVSLLNQFNNQIESANENNPVTIGGTQYDSSRQFWELKRSEYLNDRTENGFFSRYGNELKDKVDYRKSKGILSNSNLEDVKLWYNTIKDRPELASYGDKIAQDEQSSTKYTADLKAQDILNRFTTDLDAQKAVGELAYIQDTYGVDQTTNYQKIILAASQEKETQVQQVISTMQQIIQDNPGVSNQEALKQAISAGAGAIFSPEELATETTEDIITGAGEKAEGDQFKEESKTTITPPEAFAKPNEFKEGGLYRLPGQIVVHKFESGKLRPLTGDFNEESLKQTTGKGFSSVNEVKSFTGTPIGEEIKATTVQATTTKPIQPKTSSKGFVSVVDYLKSIGEDSSIESRQKLYKQQGLGEEKEFKGSAEQNTKLLKSFE